MMRIWRIFGQGGKEEGYAEQLKQCLLNTTFQSSLGATVDGNWVHQNSDFLSSQRPVCLHYFVLMPRSSLHHEACFPVHHQSPLLSDE